MKRFTIYDNKAKCQVSDKNGEKLEFETHSQADKYKDGLLESGEYPDEPHTVFTIVDKLDQSI